MCKCNNNKFCSYNGIERDYFKSLKIMINLIYCKNVNVYLFGRWVWNILIILILFEKMGFV